jgi:hypothetical protein
MAMKEKFRLETEEIRKREIWQHQKAQIDATNAMQKQVKLAQKSCQKTLKLNQNLLENTPAAINGK